MRSEEAVRTYWRKSFENRGCRALASTEILGKYPLCTIVTSLTRLQSVLETTDFLPVMGGDMQTGYTVWLGQAVVLKVELGDIQVPLRGRLLKENSETVRMRIGEGWDVDIYKTMIRGVEGDGMAMLTA